MLETFVSKVCGKRGIKMKKQFAIIGVLCLAAFMLTPAAIFAQAGGLIKVGIVNLPPEESGYRQANVEDMNSVFSSERLRA